MSWREQINPASAIWAGVEEYATERISELTMTCTSLEASDSDIRAAQAGIRELQRLISVPQMIQAQAQVRANQGARKEY